MWVASEAWRPHTESLLSLDLGDFFFLSRTGVVHLLASSVLLPFVSFVPSSFDVREPTLLPLLVVSSRSAVAAAASGLEIAAASSTAVSGVLAAEN